MALVVLILLLALTARPIIASRALRWPVNAAGGLRAGFGRWAWPAATAYAWACTAFADVTRLGLATRLALATRLSAARNAGAHQQADRGGWLTTGAAQLRPAATWDASFPLRIAAAFRSAAFVHGEPGRSVASAQRPARRLRTCCRLPACRTPFGAAVR